MFKSRLPYPAEFRQRMVDPRARRLPAEQSWTFGCTVQTISKLVARSNAGTGMPGSQGLTLAEREELTRLRHQVRQLQKDRGILAKAAARFAAHDVNTFTPSSSS